MENLWIGGLLVLLYEMIAGIDPFNNDDPMLVYQKILKGKIKFSTAFPSSVKSLVKHLLTHDLSKRYGNLKGGVNDIKNHRFFDDMDWNALIRYKLQPPYIPDISAIPHRGLPTGQWAGQDQ